MEKVGAEKLSFRGMAYKGGSGKPGPGYLQSDIEELCASLWMKLLLAGVRCRWRAMYMYIPSFLNASFGFQVLLMIPEVAVQDKAARTTSDVGCW